MKPVQITTHIFFLAVNLLVIGTNTVLAQTAAITKQCINTESKSGSVFIPPKIVSGTVLDQQGYPIPGVNVAIEGSIKMDSQTDFDGNFTIEASKGQTLIFAYVGFITEKRVLDMQYGNVNILLKEEIQYLPIDYTNMGYRDFNGMKMLESKAATSKSLADKRQRTFFGRIFHSIGNLFR